MNQINEQVKKFMNDAAYRQLFSQTVREDIVSLKSPINEIEDFMYRYFVRLFVRNNSSNLESAIKEANRTIFEKRDYSSCILEMKRDGEVVIHYDNKELSPCFNSMYEEFCCDYGDGSNDSSILVGIMSRLGSSPILRIAPYLEI